MGMSTHVIGLRSENSEIHKKHAAVLRACIDAGVEKLPKETAEYFEYVTPEEDLFFNKLQIDLDEILVEWSNEYATGLELKVSEIPEGVDVIRFYNSW